MTLASFFTEQKPEVVGNEYLVLGTLDRPAWKRGTQQQMSLQEMLEALHDFKEVVRICVKFRLPFLSESSRKLFGREPLETQLLNPMALFLNLLAHFSRTWACFS